MLSLAHRGGPWNILLKQTQGIRKEFVCLSHSFKVWNFSSGFIQTLTSEVYCYWPENQLTLIQLSPTSRRQVYQSSDVLLHLFQRYKHRTRSTFLCWSGRDRQMQQFLISEGIKGNTVDFSLIVCHVVFLLPTSRWFPGFYTSKHWSEFIFCVNLMAVHVCAFAGVHVYIVRIHFAQTIDFRWAQMTKRETSCETRIVPFELCHLSRTNGWNNRT